MFIEDGNLYRYAHRSFQEYLCATFIANLEDDYAGRIIESISDRYESDKVLHFVRSINQEKIEINWVLPKIEEILPLIKKADDVTQYVKLFEKDTDEIMKKIRVLYEFEPNNDQILHSVYAAKGMGVVEFDDFCKAVSIEKKNNPIEKDRLNFLNLFEDLRAMYQRRKITIDDLLN